MPLILDIANIHYVLGWLDQRFYLEEDSKVKFERDI
jgi:hypothetical protein